jgi:hypothetical protein
MGTFEFQRVITCNMSFLRQMQDIQRLFHFPFITLEVGKSRNSAILVTLGRAPYRVDGTIYLHGDGSYSTTGAFWELFDEGIRLVEEEQAYEQHTAEQHTAEQSEALEMEFGF